MPIPEARAVDKGILFYDNENKRTIFATRDDDGKVEVKTDNKIVNVIEKEKKYKRAIAGFTAIIFSIAMCVFENNVKAIIIIAVAVIWVTILMYYIASYLDKENHQSFRYHAAEHKVLNYIDFHDCQPPDIETAMKSSSISYRCGSTFIAMILVLGTLLTLGITFLPYIILKILWILLSLAITAVLWFKGKLNFLQKLCIKKPGQDEVEVALMGVREYLKSKNE